MDENLINKNWFKNKKNIAILILSIICAVSIGFNIYFGRTGTVDHADNIRDILTELESVMGKQYESLDTALDDIRGAIELADQLGDEWGTIRELARSANAGLVELGAILEESGGTLSVIIERQRRINEAFRIFLADYRRLEEALTQR